jgi:hypothetical protein
VKKEYQLSADESAAPPRCRRIWRAQARCSACAHELGDAARRSAQPARARGIDPRLPSALTALGVLFRTLDQHKQTDRSDRADQDRHQSARTTTPTANLTRW